MEIIIYITCGVILAFILYSFLNKKKNKEEDASVLSTQLSELSRRFTVLEEAAKQMDRCKLQLILPLKIFRICLMTSKNEVLFRK